MLTFIRRNNIVEGPFIVAEIRERLAKGVITPATAARRDGTNEWKTIGELFPAAPAAPAGPPPVAPRTPGPAPAPPAAEPPVLLPIDSLFAGGNLPPMQPDAVSRLSDFASRFLGNLDRRLGRVARPNHSFYAHRVVTTAIQRLRLDLLNGAALTAAGEEFVAGAAAYLAVLAVLNWQRRGLEVCGFVQFAPGARDSHVFFAAQRTRDGTFEAYSHDFLEDIHRVLLRPPKMFPSLQGRFYVLDSLTLPAPEYLYQYGVHLLQSPQAGGNWPRVSKVGGLDQDFAASRGLLVDDLHADCGVPAADPGLRKLSWWIVFPPYGWDMNDGNDYNFMTIFDQVAKGVVPRDVAIDYFRALLESQSLDLRNLAARTLMVWHVPPRTRAEASHYQQAMASRDWPVALASMARHQQQLERLPASPDHAAQLEAGCRAWLGQTPPTLALRTMAETDPEYVALGKIPPSAESLARFEGVMRRYPDDWVLRAIHAALTMEFRDARAGEAALRDLIRDPPDCNEAHSRLGTLLKRQGRIAEAMAVYEDEVRRWPWNHRAVDSCLWLVTEGMTRK